MQSSSIISAIDSEIRQLQEARALLSGLAQVKGKTAVPNKPPTKRRLSAAARKRIADAQKKRWAAVRAKNAA